jgi:hypothetical protein
MFTPEEREKIKQEILSLAAGDNRITGGAVTGSASVGKEDEWSDIDLAFGVRNPEDVAPTLQDFTSHMYRLCGALHHLDVHSEGWIYRVFLLSNTLQVDLAFAAKKDFGSRGPTFKLLFGRAKEQTQPVAPSAAVLIGYAWLYALHARSSIRRNKVWQAEYMISAMRDQVLSLACIRCGLPAREGRGLDQLPSEVLHALETSLIKSLDRSGLQESLQVVTKSLITEMRLVDPKLSANLEGTLNKLAT